MQMPCMHVLSIGIDLWTLREWPDILHEIGLNYGQYLHLTRRMIMHTTQLRTQLKIQTHHVRLQKRALTAIRQRAAPAAVGGSSCCSAFRHPKVLQLWGFWQELERVPGRCSPSAGEFSSPVTCHCRQRSRAEDIRELHNWSRTLHSKTGTSCPKSVTNG